MSGRPGRPADARATPRAPDALGPARLGRAVGGPRRRGPRDARLGGRDLRRRRLVRLRLREAPGRWPAIHGRRRRRGQRSPTSAAGTCSGSRPRRSKRPSRRSRPSRRRTSTSACRGPSASPSRSAGRSSSGRSGSAATWPTRTARSSRCLGKETPPGAAGLPVIEDRRAASAGLSVEPDARPGRPRRRDPSRLARPGRRRQRGGLAGRDRQRRRTASSSRRRPKGWSAVFGFYTPSLRTTELIPGQVRLLRSLLVGREQLVDRVILASETDGTYTPRATPKPSPKPKPSTAP